MDLNLRDKVVLVSGSSQGIGFAIARAFLHEGAKVVITGRGARPLQEASTFLEGEADGSRVASVLGDMTQESDVRNALDHAVSAFGGIDTVVANMGSGVAHGGWDLDQNDWQASLSINLVGGMTLASAALPHLIPRKGASITFISSIAGVEAINAPVTYSAAKAALQGAMKNLARLVAPDGVRVNAVAPGNVLFPGGSWEQKLAERGAFFEQYIQSEVPLQRFGRPEEIADAVVFLASERASFITGACLVVDGGQTRSYG